METGVVKIGVGPDGRRGGGVVIVDRERGDGTGHGAGAIGDDGGVTARVSRLRVREAEPFVGRAGNGGAVEEPLIAEGAVPHGEDLVIIISLSY